MLGQTLRKCAAPRGTQRRTSVGGALSISLSMAVGSLLLVAPAVPVGASSSTSHSLACGLVNVQELNTSLGSHWRVSQAVTIGGPALKGYSLPGLTGAKTIAVSTCTWRAKSGFLQPLSSQYLLLAVFQYAGRVTSTAAANALRVYSAPLSPLATANTSFVSGVGDWAWNQFPPAGFFAAGKGSFMVQVYIENASQHVQDLRFDPSERIAVFALRHLA